MKKGSWPFIDSASVQVLLKNPCVRPLIPPYDKNLVLSGYHMDWSLHVQVLGDLSPKGWIALIEEEIVANVHNVSKVNQLNHV